MAVLVMDAGELTMATKKAHIDLLNPPNTPKPRFHSRIKMQPAGDFCAGCLRQIEGDDWVLLLLSKNQEPNVLHNTEWCRLAARLRIFRQRFSDGMLNGREFKVMQHFGGKHRYGLLTESRLSSQAATLLACSLFPQDRIQNH